MCDLYMSYLATPEHPELQLNKVSKVLSLNTKYLWELPPPAFGLVLVYKTEVNDNFVCCAREAH